MSPRPVLRAALVLVSAATLTRGAEAAIVSQFDLGFGSSTSTVQIDFSNGNGYLFTWHYDGEKNGFDALLAFDAELPEFTLVAKDFGFGAFVTGLGVLDDYEYGTGDQWPVVENYWHYWLHDAGNWEWAPTGPSDRTLFNGSSDGWVFGIPTPPQSVPAPAAGIALAGVALLRRRRR